MTSDNKWTRANRLQEVVSTKLTQEVVGDFLTPKAERLRHLPGLSEIQDGDALWHLRRRIKTGLDKEHVTLSYFATEEAAREDQERLNTGLILGDGFGFPKRFKELVGDRDAAAILGIFFNRESDDYWFMIYECLQGAGVIDALNQTRPQVLEWIGEDNIRWMQEKFGENWTAVAELEYCANHFPVSSLAHLAAQVQFSEFISGSDFSTGYLVREMEVIYAGVEDLAQTASVTRKKAGLGGARRSRMKRRARLETFMVEIEKLSHLAGQIREDRLIAQAFENAVAENPDMPRSRRTREDYETALRSEEPFKQRYEAIFRSGT